MSAVWAIRRAIDALVATQAADGSFRDFELGVGASGPWVTAHVGMRLAGLPPRYRQPRVEAAIARARAYLDAAPAWAYNEHAPADADSIAHALLCLGPDARHHDAVRSLARFQQPDAGFATFTPDARGASFASWTRSHPDVTPVALRALAPYREVPAIAEVVARGLAHRGESEAFWWDLDWYTRAMWVATCIELGEPPDVGAPPPAPARRSLLDAAYLLAIARAAGWDALVDAIADDLLGAMTPEGRWPPSRVLRVTRPDVDRPWELHGDAGGRLFADVRGVYSAAVIATTLAACWP